MLSTYAAALTAVGQDDSAVAIVDESLVKARQAGSAERLLQSPVRAIQASAQACDIAHADVLARE